MSLCDVATVNRKPCLGNLHSGNRPPSSLTVFWTKHQFLLSFSLKVNRLKMIKTFLHISREIHIGNTHFKEFFYRKSSYTAPGRVNLQIAPPFICDENPIRCPYDIIWVVAIGSSATLFQLFLREQISFVSPRFQTIITMSIATKTSIISGFPILRFSTFALESVSSTVQIRNIMKILPKCAWCFQAESG